MFLIRLLYYSNATPIRVFIDIYENFKQTNK